MANEVPQMSIKQATLNKGSFNPQIYKPETPDVNILQRSLAQIEARQEKASEKQTAIDLALGDIENKLNPAELDWFKGYKDDIKKQIQDQVDSGNFGNAIRVANKLAGKIGSDTQILNRIKANTKYEEAKKTVSNRNDITKDTKDWWIATHQYEYDDTEGVRDYDDMPQGQADYVSLSAKAIQLAAPEKGKTSSSNSYSNSTGKGADGKVLENAVSGSHSNSYEFAKLTEEKLKEVMDGVFAGTPGAREAVIQDREVSLWKLQQLNDKIASATTPEEIAKYESQKKLYENDLYNSKGHLMSEDEYIAKKVNPILHNAAYDYKYTDTTTHNGLAPLGGGGSRNNYDITTGDLPEGFVDGFKPEGGPNVYVSHSQIATVAKTASAKAASDSRDIVSNLKRK